VRDIVGGGDVIISNQVSFLEFIFMEMAYSPCFTAVARNKKTGKFGLRKIGMFELPFFAIGIKFPRDVEDDANFYTSLKALRDSQYVKTRPIVVFPEGTKTNGNGVLSFEQDITDILIAAAAKGLNLHSLRFDYAFAFTAPYNTTDVGGFRSLLSLLIQNRNMMLIQYYFNLEEKLNQIGTTPSPTSFK
jgi:1-acyl-sn-glycerol-3-phosphate acyltransferase